MSLIRTICVVLSMDSRPKYVLLIVLLEAQSVNFTPHPLNVPIGITRLFLENVNDLSEIQFLNVSSPSDVISPSSADWYQSLNQEE